MGAIMRHSFLWSSLICLSAATVSRSQAQSCVNLDRPAVFPAPTSLAAAQAELGRHGFLRDPSAGSEERYRGRAGRVVTLLSAGGRCFGSTLRIEAADLDAEFLQLARTLTGLGPPITGGLEGLAPIMDPKYLEHIPASKSDEKLLAWADTTNRLGLVMLILVRKRDRPPFRVEVARTVLGYQDSLSRAASFAEVVDTAKYAVVSDGQSRTLILKRSIRKVEPGAVRLTTLSSGLRGMPGSDLDRIEFDLEYRCATVQSRTLVLRLVDTAGVVRSHSEADTVYGPVGSDSLLEPALRKACAGQ
jgi:hypothetical protein